MNRSHEAWHSVALVHTQADQRAQINWSKIGENMYCVYFNGISGPFKVHLQSTGHSPENWFSLEAGQGITRFLLSGTEFLWLCWVSRPYFIAHLHGL